jgi:N-acyl-D-aspartate/D-glutamate deacylase
MGTGLCGAALVELADRFEGDSTIQWVTPIGRPAITLPAAGEPRLTPLPVSGESVMRVALDGSTNGLNYVLAGEPAQNMRVQAWAFCEGNDGGDVRGGYQGILARSSYLGGEQNMIRLAWDPDRSEAGDSGDGWVKFQAYDGSTWDYFGIDPADHGATENGYFLNGTSWPSGWHLFAIEVSGEHVAAYVDDMDTPAVEGTISVTLRNGHPGLYVWTSGDWAGYFDDFAATVEALPPPPPADFDVLILGGTVIADGDSDPTLMDVGVVGDRIASMEADLSGFTAHQTIDATDLLVVPGFIDVHTHADSGGSLSAYLRQGVTTMVAGNCGSSISPTNVAATLSAREGSLGPNWLTLIGHNRLRSAAGLSGPEPTPGQLQTMRDLLGQAIDDGAFGLSTGLIYNTGTFSSTEEIISLAEVAAEHGGLYATHMRSEAETVLEAVREAIRVGREANLRVQISHAKVAGPTAWGLSDEYLDLVHQANADGMQVWIDQYPYPASQTTINVLFPTWSWPNFADAVANNREALEVDVRALIAGRGGADRVFFISGPFSFQWLDDVAASLGKDPEDVLIDDVGYGGASAVYHTMQESDVQVFMTSPIHMVGSDGPTSGHPRGSGTFPRFWGHYARDLDMFTHREAVIKTSALAARQFRLTEQGRGTLGIGRFADITVLSPDTVIDNATFEQPTLRPTGIRWVIVNGEIAVSPGGVTGVRAGRVLRLQDSQTPAGLMLR